jgi:hypothetical protein
LTKWRLAAPAWGWPGSSFRAEVVIFAFRPPIDLENFAGILVEEPLNLAVRRNETAPRIEKVFPGNVAVPDHPSIRALIERVFGVNDHSPFRIPLGKSKCFSVSDDTRVDTARTHGFGGHGVLAGHGHELCLGEKGRHPLLIA